MTSFSHISASVKILALGWLAAGASLPLSAATSVNAGANLASVINGSQDIHFLLNGNVTFGNTVMINSAGKSNITINGTGHTITQSGDSHFEMSQTNSVLTINNATIKTSNPLGGYQAMVYAYGTNDQAGTSQLSFTANLDGVIFDGLHGGAAYNGAAIHAHRGANLTVNGNVKFQNNVTRGSDYPGAVSAWHNSNLTFTGVTTFENNSVVEPGYYGGAVSIYENSVVAFKNDSTFTGNHSTAFGGAIDLWYGTSKLTSAAGTVLKFTGNYASGRTGTEAGSRGNRGGAISVSDGGGTPPSGLPQISLLGETIFEKNYAWNQNTATTSDTVPTAVGGAVALASDNVQFTGSQPYGATFGKATFRENYAGTATTLGKGFGGAVFHNGSGQLTFGNGSLFENNYAQTSGGAIYINEGTLNLNGNMTFQGNRQGVSFSSTKPVTTSGTPNAIYFGNTSGSTGKLNLAPNDNQVIRFYDPIAANSASNRYVTITKNGTGEVIFYGKNGDANYNSTLFNKTTINNGTFTLTDGVTFGASNSDSNNTFTVAAAGTLKGEKGSTLATKLLTVNGHLLVDVGGLKIKSTDDVKFSNNSVLTIVIADKSNYGTLDLGNKKITANNKAIDLQILDTGYTPSNDIGNLDRFALIGSVSTANINIFKETSLTIKGADFEIQTLGNMIFLQQVTATAIPEPQTYALFGGMALLGLTILRRKKNKK